MKKHIARFAVVLGAAAVFAAPAAPASACNATFLSDCVNELLATPAPQPSVPCVYFYTFCLVGEG